MKCIVCNKDMMDKDIFMMITIDMRRLIYDSICEDKNNFFIPDGPVHLTETLVLCGNCGSEDMMKLTPRDIATVLSQIK